MSDFFSYQGRAETAPTGAVPARLPTIGAGLSGEDWEQLIRFAARRRFAAGAEIVKTGETDRALHFIASGQVLLQGGAAPQAVRGEGEVFGVLSFLDGAPSAVSVRVTPDQPAEVLRLTPEALQQLAAWQPRLGLELMRDLGAQVAARLRQLQPAD